MLTLHGASGSYRVGIAIPDEPAPPAGFPLVLVLDANADFGTLVEAVRRGSRRPESTGIAPALVVGIFHPADGPYDAARRTLDYTPGPAREAADERGRTGGAPAFLSFITDVLLPRLATDFPLDPGRRTLFGHSLAGFFAIWTMTQRPDAFRRVLAVSPSLWWDEARLRDDLGGIAAPTEGRRRGLMIVVGQWEEELAPWQAGLADRPGLRERRQARGMIRRARAFAGDVERAGKGGIDVAFEELPGHDHSSVVPAAVSACLRFAFAG